MAEEELSQSQPQYTTINYSDLLLGEYDIRTLIEDYSYHDDHNTQEAARGGNGDEVEADKEAESADMDKNKHKYQKWRVEDEVDLVNIICDSKVLQGKVNIY